MKFTVLVQLLSCLFRVKYKTWELEIIIVHMCEGIQQNTEHIEPIIFVMYRLIERSYHATVYKILDTRNQW